MHLKNERTTLKCPLIKFYCIRRTKKADYTLDKKTQYNIYILLFRAKTLFSKTNILQTIAKFYT